MNGLRVVTDSAEAARLLEQDSMIAFDTETSGLSPWRNRLALLQFFGPETNTLAVIRTPGGVIPDPIRCLLEQPKHIFAGHNIANFDIQFLDTQGVQWQKANWYDSLVAECIVTTAGRADVSMSLKAAVKRRLDMDLEKGIDHGSWENEELTEEQLTYAALDVLVIPTLYQAQQAKAIETEQLSALQMEMEVMPAFAQMVCNGLPFSVEELAKWLDLQTAQYDEAELKLRQLLQDPAARINLGSPTQLRNAIKAVTGMPITTTNKETMAKYATYDTGLLGDIARQVLALRGPMQRKKMYRDSWVEDNVIDGFIHPRLWQCKTDTTRSSSSGPNVQQIPKDGRIVIGSRPGYSIVAVDYSQIELRIAGDLANDQVLLKAIESGTDVHRAVAADMYQVPISEVTDAQRRAAKGCSFALLFDGSASTLVRTTTTRGGKLDMNEAINMEQRFFQAYRGLGNMLEKAEAMTHRHGPVFIRLSNGVRRMLVGEHKTAATIVNTMVQGNAAVGMKRGIIEAHKRGLTKYLGAPIHDELVASVPENEAEEYGKELQECMILGMKQVTRAKVDAEVKIGYTWS